jgi:hypothetical protein
MLNEEYINYNIPNAIILMLYIVVGTLGNIAVLIVYIRDMKNVLTSGRLFIPFIAFADLLTLTYNGGIEFSREIHPFDDDTDHDIKCTVMRFFASVSVITSGVLYFAIAVHRYILVCRPYSKRIARKWKCIIMISTSVFILLLALPNLIFYGLTAVTMESKSLPNQTIVVYLCGTKEEFENKTFSNTYFIVLSVNSFIWASTLAVLYIFVGKETRQRSKKMTSPASGEENTSGSVATFIANNRLTWMFILMTVLNFVSFMPKTIVEVLYNQDRYFYIREERNMYIFLMFLDNFYLFNNVVNPFIYGFFDTEFRNRFAKRFCSYCP